MGCACKQNKINASANREVVKRNISRPLSVKRSTASAERRRISRRIIKWTMGFIQRIVHKGFEDNQFVNSDCSANAKLALINTLKSLNEITLHYGGDETLDLENGERYDFIINYSLLTNAYTESSYSDISGPETNIMNNDTDDLTIESIIACDNDTEEEIEIDDSDGQIENLIRKKYVVDDSDYDYPTKEEYLNDFDD